IGGFRPPDNTGEKQVDFPGRLHSPVATRRSSHSSAFAPTLHSPGGGLERWLPASGGGRERGSCGGYPHSRSNNPVRERAGAALPAPCRSAIFWSRRRMVLGLRYSSSFSHARPIAT